MEWQAIGSLALTYGPKDELVEYDEAGGGQVYGVLEGRLEVEGLTGTVHVTNTAPRRTDGIFEPTLRGILTVSDGSKLYFRLDGLSLADPTPGSRRRTVLSTVRLRSRVPAYQEWNRAFLFHDGRGGPTGDSWGLTGPILRAIPKGP